MFQTKVVEGTKTKTSPSINFPPENHFVYEIMWKIIVQPDRPQMTIWRMRVECWITKATNTHSEQVQGGSNMTGTDFCVNKPH